MAKIRLGKWEVEKDELMHEIEEATRRGEESLKTEIQASAARYDQVTERLVVELKNGATLSVPCNLIQGLRGARAEEIAQVKLGPRGASLHWARLDVDFSAGGLLAGRFGTQRWMEQLPQLRQQVETPGKQRASTRASRAAKAKAQPSLSRKRGRQVA